MVTATRPVAHGVPTLPGRYYFDPDIYAEELERIWSTQWICVGLAARLAKPQSYFLASIGNESIIVLRDREDTLRAFYNVCRHRASRLCFAGEGQLNATIQCPYHAWTYALDGRLVGAPYMHEDPDFDATSWGLNAVHLQVWQGLIFLNLSDAPGTLQDQGDVDHPRIPRFAVAGLVSAKTLVDEVQANWKMIIANYNECAHCAPVHPELAAKVPTFKMGLTTGGLDHGADFAEGVETLTPSGKRARPALPGLLPEDQHRYYGINIWPNVFLDMQPDYVTVATLHPEGPTHTRIVTDVLFHPDTMALPDFDPSDAIEFTVLVNGQDWRVCEISQLGVASRSFRQGGIYGPHERHIREYDDLVLDKLGHPHD